MAKGYYLDCLVILLNALCFPLCLSNLKSSLRFKKATIINENGKPDCIQKIILNKSPGSEGLCRSV